MSNEISDPIRVGRFWVFDDGTRLPVVSGGADDSGAGGDGGTDGGAGGDAGAGTGGGSQDDPTASGGLPDDPAVLQRMIADLRKENAGHRTKNKELEPLADEARKLREAAKSDTERLTEQVTSAASRADAAEAKLLRYEVAASAGIPLDQAHRLVGATREELEADAKTFASMLGSGTSTPSAPAGRPREQLRGSGSMDAGGSPAVDIRKMIDDIPRG